MNNTPMFERLKNNPIRAIRRAQLMIAADYNRNQPNLQRLLLPEDVAITHFSSVLKNWKAQAFLDGEYPAFYEVTYDGALEKINVNVYYLKSKSNVWDEGDPTHNTTEEYEK